MRKHLVILIDWYGPYSIDEARNIARTDYSAGLYFAIGSRTGYAEAAKPLYVGLSKNLGRRLNGHHKLPSIDDGLQIWLGEVGTAEPGGKKLKVTQTTLDYAEWLHAYYLELELNEKKRKSTPDRSVTVLNHWWKKDYDTAHRRPPHPTWPNLIDFVDSEHVWVGKAKRWKPNS